MIEILNCKQFPYSDGLNPFILTKIKANFLAYGCDFSFLTFWVQKCQNKITAIISKMENTLFITANSSANFKEIKEFIQVIGYNNLQTDEATAYNLNLSNTKSYTLLSMPPKADTCPTPKVNTPSIKRVYDILFETRQEDISPTLFDAFYADLSHKIRHDAALAVLTDDCATAVASHITDDFAVISGVAVTHKKRGAGLGRVVTKKLISLLNDKTIYVAANTAAEFYKKLGFVPCGKIEIIEN